MALTPLPEPLRPTVFDTPPDCPKRWPAVEALDSMADVVVTPVGNWYAGTKSAVDWCAAVFLLIPGLPLIGLCWLGVRLTSAGPGFYLQARLGRGGREYPIIKLRTMTHNAEQKAGGAKWSPKGDTRITGFGKFLRKTHFDELPQLFNVLMGHMSLVGPRPERKAIVEKLGLQDRVPGYRHRLLVKPGVTGLAQVQLPPDEDLNSVKHKVAYDLYYIEHYSLWLDVRLMVATVLNSAGVRAKWSRRIFGLPHRDRIAEVFHSNVAVPPGSAVSLQPI